MKQPTFFQRLKAAFRPVPINPIAGSQIIGFNSGVTIYPHGLDNTYIHKGYRKNAWVYSIVSKCARKFSQVPWYHYRIKTSERKTWAEYQRLTKEISDPKAVIEAKKMRIKSVDQVVVDSPLTALLKRPNRNQSGAQFFEQLYGFKLLTGEGNIWMPRLEEGGKPTEMVTIPKQLLGLVKGLTPWTIEQYKLMFPGGEIAQPKENIISWKFANYEFDATNLTHLRGQAPLDAGLLILQSSNEAAERLVAMNKNQGVAGMVFDKAQGKGYPTQEQANFMRRQFKDIVHDPELVGAIGYLTGDLGYLQFGLDAGQLKLLEQSEVDFQALCNIFDIPWQLFAGNAGTYENRKQYKRDFVYDNIAVAAYSLRDDLNARLIPEFGLDRDRDVIDVDILCLPELTEDLKTQIESLSKADFLTPNEKREQAGYDMLMDKNMDKVYMSGSVQTVEQLNTDIGKGLDDEINQLGE